MSVQISQTFKDRKKQNTTQTERQSKTQSINLRQN